MAIGRRAKKLLAWYLPEPSKVFLYRLWQKIYDIRLDLLKVEYKTDLMNIYHCTVHKAGSQWFQALLTDPLIYQWCGLKPWNRRVWGIDPRSYHHRYYRRAFPSRRIISPLYIHFDAFKAIRKPAIYRDFFVMRDPRDITVSYYFSMVYSHTPMGDVLEKRSILRQMGQKEGIMWMIQHLKDYGLYDALRSWKGAGEVDPNVLVVRLEDFSGACMKQTLLSLFKHCDIRIPDEILEELISRYRFDMMRARDHRKTNGLSHYRSGKAGDWQNYFDRDIENHFRSVTGDLVEYLGYE